MILWRIAPFTGLEQYISGVILYEETLYQKTDEGKEFSTLLREKGIIVGIKVGWGRMVVAHCKVLIY
jgi:fructose-bisphosphate aldolase class I